MSELLPGESTSRTQTLTRRECDICTQPAEYRVTFLVNDARRNPASSAYGRDDCTWCADAEIFACEEHKNTVRRNPPAGMDWCGTFAGSRFPNMLLHWVTL